jgi:hypothetical protein
MNLVAIQEKLKDFPNQVIMAYANGQNPEVPAYMALAELQRRKRMSQGMKEAPKETVKDRIERESVQQATGLLDAQMGAQQARQAQQPQQLQQPQAEPPAQPQAMAPQPEMPAMAAGGITRLPVGDMFNYRDGGIVAFADEGLVDYESQMSGSAPMKRGKTKQEVREEMERERAENMRRVALEGQNQRPTMRHPDLLGATPVEETVQGSQPAPRPPRVMPRPSAGESPGGVSALPRQDLAMDMLKKSQEMINQKPEIPETYEALMERARAKNPALQKPIGADYQKKLEELSEFDKEARGKFGEREAARSKQDFYDALIAAGEATRGGGGIGSLLGGFGKASSASRASAQERAARQEALQREQDLNMAKLNSELENLRRAEAIGDVKAQQESLAKIADIKNTMKQNQMTLQANTAQTAATLRGQNMQAETARAQTAAYRKNELFDIAERIRPQYPNLTEEQLLQKALPFTRAGVGAESKLDVVTENRLKELDKKRFLNAQVYANDSKKLAAANALLDQEEQRIRREAGGAAPSGGGTRIKLDANGVPIQ